MIIELEFVDSRKHDEYRTSGPINVLARDGDWSITRELDLSMTYISHHNCTERYFRDKNTGEYITFNDSLGVIEDKCSQCNEKIPEKILFLYKLLTT